MPEYSSYIERRVFPRYSLHLTGEAEALYRRNPASVNEDHPKGGNSKSSVDVVNVSAGGFMLTFDETFDTYDILQMQLNHPETGHPLVFEGQLVWVRKNASDLLGKFCGGLVLRNTPSETIEALVSYAAKLGPPVF